jgi:hypothetical protein
MFAGGCCCVLSLSTVCLLPCCCLIRLLCRAARLHRLQSLAAAVVAFVRPLVSLQRCFRAVCFNLFWTVVLADAFAR